MEVYGLLASGYGDWPIIKQIAWLLGQVMNGIFNVLSKIGIENIGVCIIILLTGHKNLRFENIFWKKRHLEPIAKCLEHLLLFR